MKQKRFTLLFVFIFLIIASASAFAHPGRTDSKGGHYDRQNGGYHYHHGYSAHHHPNGVCPYETENSYYVQDDDYISDNKKNKSSFDFLVKLSSDFTWHTSDAVHLLVYFFIIAIIIRVAFFQRSKITKSILTLKILNANHICLFIYFAIGLVCSLSLVFPYHLSGFEFILQWSLIGIVEFLLFTLVFSSIILIPVFITLGHFYERFLMKSPDYDIIKENLFSYVTPSVTDNKLVCEIKRKIIETNKKSNIFSQIVIPPSLLTELNNTHNSKEKAKLLNFIYCEILLQIDSKKLKKEISCYFRIILNLVS